MKSGVYEIRNVSDGRRYIGSSAHIKKRLVRHLGRLRRGTHINPHLQAAWVKHGPSAFEFRPLLFCSVENLLMYEQRLIDGLRPEYNIAKYAGAPMRGRKASAEALAKCAESRRGKIYKISEEQRAKISATHRGKILSPETRSKIGMSKLGNRYCVGRRQTPEAIEKISAAHIGKTLSQEHRAKIAAANVGKQCSPATREKISNAHKGKKFSLEHRQRLSEAWKLRAPMSLETREKMSASLRGRPKTAEHNAKVSAALKGRILSPEHRKNISIARARSSAKKSTVRDVA